MTSSSIHLFLSSPHSHTVLFSSSAFSEQAFVHISPILNLNNITTGKSDDSASTVDSETLLL